jgi:hypothetical protein
VRNSADIDSRCASADVAAPPTIGQLNDEVIISTAAIKANLPFNWTLIDASSTHCPTLCALRTRRYGYFNRANLAEFRNYVG